MPPDDQHRLIRETFKTSRLAEFVTVGQLVAQTGHGEEDWPLVIVKELVDDALDACEEERTPPVERPPPVVAVEVSTKTGVIRITDNGPGIPAETVHSLRDYTRRTSSRAGYVGPSRGQQGNALQTIIAMPFVLDGSIGETVIEAHGIAHHIRFSVDPIRQEPQVSLKPPRPSLVRNGTRVTVRWPAKASHILVDAADRFLPFLWNVVAVNPHLTLTFDLDGENLINMEEPTDPAWEKWRPTDPLFPHWFTAERLQRLLAAEVALDREHGKPVRLVRDFVGQFRHFTSTKKLAGVLKDAGLARGARLDASFFPGGDHVDHAGIARLLAAMQKYSRPAKPETLGLIGEEHLRRVFDIEKADLGQFRYWQVPGIDEGGLPFIVEAAFAPTDGLSSTPRLSGINWSASVTDPFARLGRWRSLDGVLAERHVYGHSEAVTLVHLAAPVVQFTDRGKASIAIGRATERAIIAAVTKVTRKWHDDYEAALRASHQRQRQLDRDTKQALKEERNAERQARGVTVGTGVLYKEIAEAAEQAGLPLKALTVLSAGNDPYRRDTTTGHRNGRWFADQVASFVAADRKVHLRGLHYRIATGLSPSRISALFPGRKRYTV